MVAKISQMLLQLKSYWKTPPKGYQVSYKEFVNLSMGFGGVSFISVLISWTTLAMNIPMMISYFKMSSGMIFVLGILTSVITLIRAPFLSMIIDNSNSAKGKFKPFLLWTTLFTCICFGLIPFIPQRWTENVLMTFSIPDIPAMGVAASEIHLSLAVLIVFILIQCGTTFNTILNQAMAGIEQTITSVAQERANIGALKGLICNIPSSVINIIMPAVAGIFFAVGSTTGMNNIMVYRIFFPVCAVGGLIFILFAYSGTKERVIVHRHYVAKVKFRDGAKELSKNKYFWIITVLNVVVGIRALSNIYYWTCTYGIGGKTGDTAIAVCNMVLNNAFIPGMIFGPMLIKRFGKRNCLLFANLLYVVMVAVQLLAVNSPYLILVCIFFQNLCGGFYYISGIMVSDVLDYQQWKSGRRLEGFWQNYTAVIATLIGMFTAVLQPLFLSFAGIGFGDNLDVALQNPELMTGAFRYTTILALGGAILSAIPMVFYDLTEDKHANYVRVLKIRAASENYAENTLTDDDIININEIVQWENETGDTFVAEELSRHSCIDVIAADYEGALQRRAALQEKERHAEAARKKELEEKRKIKSGK